MHYDANARTMQTERLLLRPFCAEDAETVAQLCNNIKVYQGTLNLPYPYTVEGARAWIASHPENVANDRFYDFAVTDWKTGTLYGCVGLASHAKDNNGELGYWMGEMYWGRGYATEAVQAMLAFAFTHKGYHKVYARHFQSNPASGRVMQKAGMRHEGTQIDQVRKDGQYKTLLLYGILNPKDMAQDDAAHAV